MSSLGLVVFCMLEDAKAVKEGYTNTYIEF